ncbi:MAG TPA: tyrosine-type recombinase/integrase, partial [Sorangium sp.]|nr:tyrosine-type recombinase/integrase [Sorangium sp.]
RGRARGIVRLSAEAGEDHVDVCRHWLALLPSYAPHNPEALVFPGARGSRISKGKTPLIRSEMVTLPTGRRKQKKVDLFDRHLAAAGIVRPVRWHDLRHSCASSLVAGWWGRRWTLEEVREHLGYTSIASTHRYAHLSETAIKGAVRQTPGWAAPLPTSASIPPEVLRLTPRNHSVGRQGLEPLAPEIANVAMVLAFLA